MNNNRFSDHVRIIGAIATKDILDALRNKTTLSVLIGVVMMMFSAQALPLLLKISETQRIAVYDVADSGVISSLNEMDAVRVYKMNSTAQLESFVRDRGEDFVGVTIPEDFQTRTTGSDPVTLDAFLIHWTIDEVDTIQAVSASLGQAVGQPVQLALQPVYPEIDTEGRPIMVSMVLVMGVFVISGVLVPFLMMEEKENHTMDALLVSPATPGQMVTGKALAGMVYGLVAVATIILFNEGLVLHWAWICLTALLGAVFAVAVGLLLGTLFENQANMNLWMSAIFMVTMLPIFLIMVMKNALPAVLLTLIPGLPTVAMEQMFRHAFVRDLPIGLMGQNLTILLAWTAVLYVALIWLVRRADR